jgi:hypothetical protein
MKYEQGERDLVMLQHKFVVEWADGSEVWHPSQASEANVNPIPANAHLHT